MLGMPRIAVFFQRERGSWCSKSRLAKAAGAEVAVELRKEMARDCGAKRIFKSKCTKHRTLGDILEVATEKNGTPLWREAHFQVKREKNTSGAEPFLKWMARRCGATLWRDAAIWKKWHDAVARSTFVSENTEKHTGFSHFWKFRCPKMAPTMWREAHWSVQMYKTHAFCHTFRPSDVEKVLPN